MTEAVNSGGVKEKKNVFFVSEKYRTALRSQSQSLWVKIRDLHQIRVKYQIHWQHFSGVETWIFLIYFFSKNASLIDLRVSGKHDGTLPSLIYVNKRKPFSHHNTVFQDSQ